VKIFDAGKTRMIWLLYGGRTDGQTDLLYQYLASTVLKRDKNGNINLHKPLQSRAGKNLGFLEFF